MIEAVSTSEMSFDLHETTQRSITEDIHHHLGYILPVKSYAK
jgi:hypothetical protein